MTNHLFLPIILLWSEDKSSSSTDHASYNNDNETSISKATDTRCDVGEVRDDGNGRLSLHALFMYHLDRCVVL